MVRVVPLGREKTFRDYLEVNVCCVSLGWHAAVPRNQAPRGTTILVYSTTVNVGVILRPLTSLTTMENQRGVAWGLDTSRVTTKTAATVLEVETKTTCTA